ncbi:poly(rC)-binding protein 2/3/4 [Spatholobus suberectus]|nr:poly(rC)-binding protein 2/3/4 [Spatholobus suberectus]
MAKAEKKPEEKKVGKKAPVEKKIPKEGIVSVLRTSFFLDSQLSRHFRGVLVAVTTTTLKALSGAASYIDSVHNEALLFAVLRMSLWNYGIDVMDGLMELIISLVHYFFASPLMKCFYWRNNLKLFTRLEQLELILYTIGYSFSGPESAGPAHRMFVEEEVFKLLCHHDKVGSLIGKGGSVVQALQNETGASIQIVEAGVNLDKHVVVIKLREA